MELTKFIQEGQVWLSAETEILRKLDKEREFIDDIRMKLEAWNKKAKEQNMRCPSIAVYIHIEKDIEMLEQLRKDSDRKVHIIEVFYCRKNNQTLCTRMIFNLQQKVEIDWKKIRVQSPCRRRRENYTSINQSVNQSIKEKTPSHSINQPINP